MLAIVLRTLLVVELLAYAVAALRVLGIAPVLVPLCAVAGVLLVRALPNATIWLLARQWGGGVPPLGFLATARMVLAEYAAFVACFVVILPFERMWMGCDRLAPGDRPPLLLVHGYGCSRGVWWWLRRRLEAAGWSVATLNLEPVYASIDDYVAPLSQRIDEVLRATGAARLILVGHSMGGLAARACLRHEGCARVARLITLGTPHAGSRLARIGPGRNARQMVPGSAWLQALDGVPPGLDCVTLYSRHDNYVLPRQNLALAGATARPLDGIGHLAMLFSPAVAGVLLSVLERPAPTGAGWKLRRM